MSIRNDLDTAGRRTRAQEARAKRLSKLAAEQQAQRLANLTKQPTSCWEMEDGSYRYTVEGWPMDGGQLLGTARTSKEETSCT